MINVESYLAPDKLDDAIMAMAAGDVTVVCGGTDLRRIEEMAGITESDNTIRIGALATVTDIMEDELIRDCAPVLVEAGDQFASDQIRNAASIGGNLCNASPAGDMSIPLLVLDASVELASWQDGKKTTRIVPLDGFFTGPGQSVKGDNELLTAVVFDKPAENFVGRFRKSGPRPALEISTVSIGVGGKLNDGTFSHVSFAMGAVAPTPLRAPTVEATLEGKPLNNDIIAAAVEAAVKDATPIDDIRASAWYRRHLVRVFTEEVLTHVAEN